MRWLKDGKVHGTRLGRRWLIPGDEVRRILDPNSEPAPEPRFPITSGRPLIPSWLDALLPEEISDISNELGDFLRVGGAPVNIEGLQRLVRGDEPPTAVFWRYFSMSIRNLKNLTVPVPPDVNEQKEFAEPRNTAKQDGEPEDLSRGNPSRPAPDPAAFSGITGTFYQGVISQKKDS